MISNGLLSNLIIKVFILAFLAICASTEQSHAQSPTDLGRVPIDPASTVQALEDLEALYKEGDLILEELVADYENAPQEEKREILKQGLADLFSITEQQMVLIENHHRTLTEQLTNIVKAYEDSGKRVPPNWDRMRNRRADFCSGAWLGLAIFALNMEVVDKGSSLPRTHCRRIILFKDYLAAIDAVEDEELDDILMSTQYYYTRESEESFKASVYLTTSQGQQNYSFTILDRHYVSRTWENSVFMKLGTAAGAGVRFVNFINNNPANPAGWGIQGQVVGYNAIDNYENDGDPIAVGQASVMGGLAVATSDRGDRITFIAGPGLEFISPEGNIILSKDGVRRILGFDYSDTPSFGLAGSVHKYSHKGINFSGEGHFGPERTLKSSVSLPLGRNWRVSLSYLLIRDKDRNLSLKGVPGINYDVPANLSQQLQEIQNQMNADRFTIKISAPLFID